ncbi:MAG: hypothetical protein KF729_07445 [Sandaracinaceae bacterium]|nr:hypothetical protein [Sandaracinaceae bacterium]
MSEPDDDADLEDELDLDDEGEPAPVSDRDRRRRRLERILPKVLQRAIERGLESGLETLRDPGEALRGVVGEKNVRLPKEIVGYVFSQVDDTKNAMVRVVAHEIRDFLAATDLSKELQKALTALSFEIRTEIRFIPNDSGGLKPVVKADIDPPRRRSRWRRAREEE